MMRDLVKCYAGRAAVLSAVLAIFFLVACSPDGNINEELVSENAYKEAVELVQRTSREEGIDKLLIEHDVAVLVSTFGVIVPRIDPVNGDVWPAGWPGLGSLAARAGYPHATVHMGGFRKLPMGLSFVGGSNDDARILAYAFAYEQQSQRRMEPEYLTGAEQVDVVGSGLKLFKD